MIGVAFLNEMVFMAIGALIGWMLGRKFEWTKQWMISKGIIKKGKK